MRRVATVMLAVVMMMVMGVGVASAQSIQDRIHKQQVRIDRGVANGQLTRGEFRVLQDNLNWIRDRYESLRERYGKVPYPERQKLERMLNKNEAMIYNKRHNSIRRVY